MDARGYAIRRYEPGDREEVLSLFTREGEMRQANRWFDWRFVENPFASEVPITVAEADGRVVALRSSLPVPMAVNGEQTLARLHADAIVHPDHRRRGIFSRIVQADHERFREGRSTISYGTPNEGSLSALRSHEGVPTDRGVHWSVPRHVRLTRAAALARALTGLAGGRDWARAVASRASRPPASRDATRESRSKDRVDVVRYDSVPAGLLGSLPFDRDRREVHAVRDERFYRWRMANPWYEYSTYAAESAGETLASAVVETRRLPLEALPIPTPRSPEASPMIDRVVDLRPIDGRSTRRGAWAALARGILTDTDAVLLDTLGSRFPRDVTSGTGLGSIADDAVSFAFDRLASPTTLIAWPIDGGEGKGWHVNGLDLTVPEHWRLLRCDLKAF